MTAPASAQRTGTYRLLTQNREELNSAIEGLPADKMLVPVIDDWSVKDILTHITSWDELLLPDIYRLARGRVAGLACNVQEANDKWNDLLMSVRGHFPLDQVLAEFVETRYALLKALDEIPDDQFDSGYIPGNCQVTAFHDWEHARDIRAWRDREGV
jgi:DinB superfamily